MNPNYLNPGMPATYPGSMTMPYQMPMAQPAQQQAYPGYMAMPSYGYPMYGNMQKMPKLVNSAVNIDINAESPNGNLPFYPGMAQVMQPQMLPAMMPQMQPAMPQVMMPPMPQPQALPPMMMPPAPQPQMMPPQMMPPVMFPSEQQQLLTPPALMPPQMQPVPMPVLPPQPVAPPPPAIDQTKPEQPKVDNTAPTDQTKAGTPKSTLNEKVVPLDVAIKSITPEDPANQPTLDKQVEALKTISGFINGINEFDAESQNQVNELLLPNDGRTFKALAAIASSDTSSVPPQQKQKADEVRVMGLLTLANLQKYFRQEFDKQLKKENITDVPSISLGELPAIQTVQEIIQADPNPEVREAGIYAIMGIVDPANKQDMQVLKTILETSIKNEGSKSNPNGNEKVKKTAEEALAVVNKNNV